MRAIVILIKLYSGAELRFDSMPRHLLRNKLVEKHPNCNQYRITEEGKSVVEAMNHLLVEL